MESNSIEVSQLNGTDGFTINDVELNDYLGSSFSSAGDINGDGIADLIIGAASANRNGETNVGEAYVVFGSNNIGNNSTIELSELNVNNGFIINGIDKYDRLGSGASSTGDINGDGFADIIIGASGGNAPYLGQYYGYSGGGQNYVILGGNNVGNTGSIEVSDLDGSNGFAIDRTDVNKRIGSILKDAGDINGDGFDDFIVRQNELLLNFRVSDVRLYIVFGSEDIIDNGNLNLSDIDGNNGFVINNSGGSYVSSDISTVGDIDGDGFDDLVVTTYENGKTVAFFGSENIGNTGSIDVLNLDSNSNEFLEINFDGGEPYGYDSFNVSKARDINGDGFDDFIISSSYSRTAVIFGNSNLNNIGNLDFADLNGSNGFIIDTSGFTNYDNSSIVSNAGDFNNDGFADLVVNADRNNPDYIIFGSENLGNTGNLDFADLDNLNSLIIDDDTNNYSSIGDGGDINGDGFDDLLVFGTNAIIFGRESSTQSTIDGTPGNDTLNGTNNGETINALAGDDSVVAFGGNDTINGSSGQDTLFGNNGNDNILGGGGNDVLWGQQNDDSIAGERGSDRILGNSGNDTLLGGSDSDTISGGDGNDSLQGNQGNDLLKGNGGNDTIWGGLNNDNILAGVGADRIFGGEGNDTLLGQAGNDILVGGAGFDFANGNSNSDTLLGGQGNDTLSGNAGNDSIVGEDGNDLLFGNQNSDTLVGGKGIDTLWGGAGNDFFTITRGENVDRVQDFVRGEDKLVLAADLNFNNLTLRQAGNNTQIRFNNNGIDELLTIVENNNVADFNVTDFRRISDGIDLSNLKSDNGFIFSNPKQGFINDVSNIGDINNDGIDDIIIGGIEGYVIFGGNNLDNIQPADLDGTKGFIISDRTSIVSDAGDVNNDGIDDLVVTASIGDFSDRGSSYVIFGANNIGSNGTINLADIDGNNGFVVRGVNAGDRFGISVSSAGDVNNDGIDDIIFGASNADPNNTTNAGTSYVVFGGDNLGSNGSVNLANLNSNNGFAVNGIGLDTGESTGVSVSNLGDINGDGIDDLIIGSRDDNFYVSPSTGNSYVVFGQNNVGNNGTINLADLNGNNGFVISGDLIDNFFSSPVSNAGDINGDGFDDVIIAASRSDANGVIEAGTTYIVFGDNNIGSNGTIDLTQLNGNNGFVINGIERFDNSGNSVSSAGDINNDGFADILINSNAADANGQSYAGQAYIIFGNRDLGNGGSLDLASLNGVSGLTFNGANEGDRIGRVVSGAGDINNDGLDDLILGGSESYIIFGSTDIVSAFDF